MKTYVSSCENTRNRIESFVAARSGACRNVRVKPAIAGETSVLLIAAIKRHSQLHNRAVVPLGPKLSKLMCHRLHGRRPSCMYIIYTHTHIYIYIYTHTYIYILLYIYYIIIYNCIYNYIYIYIIYTCTTPYLYIYIVCNYNYSYNYIYI